MQRGTPGVPLEALTGVHCGSLASGVVGTYRWQYKCCSMDYLLARHVALTSSPGSVHSPSLPANCLHTIHSCYPDTCQLLWGCKGQKFRWLYPASDTQVLSTIEFLLLFISCSPHPYTISPSHVCWGIRCPFLLINLLHNAIVLICE